MGPIKQIASGGYATDYSYYDYYAEIDANNSLWMWGYGQFGDGTTIHDTPVKKLDNVISVSLGAEHFAAIRADHSLWVWGQNEYGKWHVPKKANKKARQMLQGVVY